MRIAERQKLAHLRRENPRLQIARDIVGRLHDVRAGEARSAGVGKGSVFALRLPLAHTGASAEALPGRRPADESFP